MPDSWSSTCARRRSAADGCRMGGARLFARDTHHLSAITAVAMGIAMSAQAPSSLHPSYESAHHRGISTQ
jgi:hypothetical protein